ncbi:MAG: nucleotide exchange factor GrpE [Nanoarchaeota archaeon]|nr:nucleotide exchange factor GrpE [Nanoarchaeota archaeon]
MPENENPCDEHGEKAEKTQPEEKAKSAKSGAANEVRVPAEIHEKYSFSGCQKVENFLCNPKDFRALADELAERLKYLQADFDNYRKKFEKEKEKIIELANESLIKELLIILDDFERALLQTEGKNREGLALLQKNFFRILESRGLGRIEALGKKFDPFLHEALAREKSEKDAGTILEELQKGFMLKSKAIRPAKVKVAESAKEENKSEEKIP